MDGVSAISFWRCPVGPEIRREGMVSLNGGGRHVVGKGYLPGSGQTRLGCIRGANGPKR
jgi:hypothetical protein